MNYVVPIDKLASVWPEVCPWIERALLHGQGDEGILDVFVALARGAYLLWHQPQTFAAVVQIIRQPKQTVATVLYCGGNDLKAIAAAFDYGREWAKANGVDVVRVWGREGWERALGLQRIGVILQVAVK